MTVAETLLDGSTVATSVRVLLALPFLWSAIDKLRHRGDALSEFRALGMPLPALALACTVALQSACGLMLAIGWHARWAAAALAAFTLAASLVAHPFWRETGERARLQRTTFSEHLAIVGGLLGVTVGA